MRPTLLGDTLRYQEEQILRRSDITKLKAEAAKLMRQLDEAERVLSLVHGWLGVLPERVDLTDSLLEDVEYMRVITQRLLAVLIAGKG